ncbi:hypothetical protein HET73_03240 [Wolbachia endosymbiont of Atemnus politus]|uniref:hypothetical protein n=1 Tax=Wolbachia endosymbiont of Atemnus politus TaxID=2682840 RepID=UPI001573A742|nr:hypothetical protein [Wolbachia endosymbiont of Atemnus politus]NSM56554.1 hypothetical protein [Wolbachia endosymbiont of Atemnus politus]NSX83393.1 hypothetical protein [Wolbachia endosymbiont of Atemnus politus]
MVNTVVVDFFILVLGIVNTVCMGFSELVISKSVDVVVATVAFEVTVVSATVEGCTDVNVV